MIFIIEYDGPLVDLRQVYYDVYCAVAAEVGWSRVDGGTYWRLVRKHGPEANVLIGAKPAKLKQYLSLFDDRIDADDVVRQHALQPGLADALTALLRDAECRLVTLGRNLIARRSILNRAGLSARFTRTETLNSDPRRRPAELTALAAGDPRTVVAASNDSIIRAAGRAGLFTAGLSCGACSTARLQQAGADVVYPDLQALAESVGAGGPDMVRAGLLPFGPA